MNEKVNKWIEEHIDEYTKDLIDFCSINSVKSAYEEGKPYGDGSFDALNFGIDLAAKYGFPVQSYDGYVGTADFDAALPRSLDILAHTDVVPAGGLDGDRAVQADREGWPYLWPWHLRR